MGLRSILISEAEVHGVWNLATNYHGACFLSFLQTSSLLQAPIQAGLAPDCVEETLYQISTFHKRYICEQLAYERHLSTYPPSDRAMGVGKTRNETKRNETEATPTSLQVIRASASRICSVFACAMAHSKARQC